MSMGAATGAPYMRTIRFQRVVVPRVYHIVINGYPLAADQLLHGWDTDSMVLLQYRKAAAANRAISLVTSKLGVTTLNHLRQLHKTLMKSQMLYARESCFNACPSLLNMLGASQHR